MNISTWIACALLLIGCAGERGADGIDGVDGEPGARGEQGEPGADGVDGEDGMAGPRGPQGEPGMDGEDAADPNAYRPLLSILCSVAFDLVLGDGSPGQDGIDETGLVYSFVGFSNGDADVSCNADAGPDMGSGGRYFPQPTVGAATGVCSASLDYPPLDGIAGRWDFELGSSAPAAEYIDDDAHPLDGATFTFIENDCNVREMNDAGVWSDSTLGDVL
jgi:hypothetical protein